LFGTILKEAAKYQAALRFVRWGEPTLHPQCFAFCRLARQLGLKVWINTNGTLIDDEAIDTIIHLSRGPNAIKFSFQGATAEQYKKWRGEDNFEKLFETIGKVHRRRGRFATPFIQIGSTITDESTEMEVAEFRRLAEKIADKVEIGRTKKIGIDYCPLAQNCPEVFDKLSINWEGTVVACCSDYDGELIVGNLAQSTLKVIWDFSPKLREIRKDLVAGDFKKYKLCGGCNDTGNKRGKRLGREPVL
jgi:MoaA/NifB/PqqE/SkfB family radical SAM enzyme